MEKKTARSVKVKRAKKNARIVYSVGEVAEILEVNSKNIYNLINQGRIKTLQFGGEGHFRRIHFNELGEIRRILEAKKKKKS